jgi:3-methyladenine DNA glycosylase AlkD
MEYKEIIAAIKSGGSPDNIAGMARFGINPANNYGCSIPKLRQLAKACGKNHELALRLWASGIHDARLLAGFVAVPALTSEGQMEAWAGDFDSWDICDQVCSNLFDKTPFASRKAVEWSLRPEPFVRRAGFVLMAALAVHDKKADDRLFAGFLPLIAAGADDERNFVKKAVNWALRQIGKRNQNLNRLAVETAEEIHRTGNKAGRWIAADALRELRRRDMKWARGFVPPPEKA